MALMVIEGNTITPAHSCLPYLQKSGQFVETRLQELEHESTMGF